MVKYYDKMYYVCEKVGNSLVEYVTIVALILRKTKITKQRARSYLMRQVPAQ